MQAVAVCEAEPVAASLVMRSALTVSGTVAREVTVWVTAAATAITTAKAAEATP